MSKDAGHTPESAPRREAGALNCPQCGAGVPARATRCPFCTVKLATIACPDCFGMVFLGSHHCQHCGAKVQEPRARDGASYKCPRGCGDLQPMTLARTNFDECPLCGGVWLATPVFEQLTVKTEQQAPFLMSPIAHGATAPSVRPQTVRYAPCPECRSIMNRVNFAKVSGVLIDVCTGHGVWFDADELRQIITFIQAGGLAVSRAREVMYLEEQRRAALFRARLEEATNPRIDSDAARDRSEATSWAATMISMLTS